MFIIYDLIIITVFILWYLPGYLFRAKFHAGFMMRLGIFPRQLKDRLSRARPIWLHAVSVGEVIASRNLLEDLRREYPRKQIVVSTVTAAGNSVARKIIRQSDTVIFLPLDISFITDYAVRLVNPAVMVIMETEIWPNLIRSLNKRDIPIAMVNARISNDSFNKYRWGRFMLKPVLGMISLFCVQTKADADRFECLGAEKDKIKITGNMKFDSADLSSKTIDSSHYRKNLGLENNARLFVAGSTHPKEEEIILKAYKELYEKFPDLRLLIAPRHPKRAGEIERLAVNNGFSPLRVSRLNCNDTGLPSAEGGKFKNLSNKGSAHPGTVFILDTIGQLASFYAIADIVFIGKSLIKKGGQNILEPAFFARPILFGPYMFNFQGIAELFLAENAAVMVKDKRELIEKASFILSHPIEGVRLGSKAKELLMNNKGAARRNAGLIRGLALR